MQKRDILSRFLVEKKEDPKNLDDKYLRDIILNFIIAGRDTTAVTLSWLFYMLCKHPSMQEKLAREIKEETKTNKRKQEQQEATDSGNRKIRNSRNSAMQRVTIKCSTVKATARGRKWQLHAPRNYHVNK